ncbi:hypothetical protein EV361DRAFT_1036162 [Lentinula raphanica]|uniref:Uncharacterized protein n=1 Tax=Lentinula raphanica TaxID=153919 RepID=A0AA38UJD2_9AGAR|nr:hypothetical protein F5878DRAFT_706796 [Lentinula raphanica]KAJ3967694.1 hypothetical protein EV361DRAFT_1036162 [Lentinula raphanica]
MFSTSISMPNCQESATTIVTRRGNIPCRDARERFCPSWLLPGALPVLNVSVGKSRQFSCYHLFSTSSQRRHDTASRESTTNDWSPSNLGCAGVDEGDGRDTDTVKLRADTVHLRPVDCVVRGKVVHSSHACLTVGNGGTVKLHIGSCHQEAIAARAQNSVALVNEISVNTSLRRSGIGNPLRNDGTAFSKGLAVEVFALVKAISAIELDTATSKAEEELDAMAESSSADDRFALRAAYSLSDTHFFWPPRFPLTGVMDDDDTSVEVVGLGTEAEAEDL